MIGQDSPSLNLGVAFLSVIWEFAACLHKFRGQRNYWLIILDFWCMPLGLTFAQFRLDVDALFDEIMTLYIVQMPRVYTC